MIKRILAVWMLVFFAWCIMPADERVALDHEVGRAESAAMSIEVEQGHAAVRAFDGELLELWAQSPVLRVRVELREPGPRTLRLHVFNCMRDAVLVQAGESSAGEELPGHRAGRAFEVAVSDGALLELGVVGAQREEAFTFAVLSDVQSGVDRVSDVFARMNQDPELSFVVSTGDLVDTGAREELVRFQRELAILEVPLFSTVGNHEMGAPPQPWHEVFGPFNVHFVFKGTTFSLLDSGNATIDPHVYDRLDAWLAGAQQAAHVVLTHVPPLDPIGLRGGAFRSRKEAAKLMQKLADGRVDALFLGHIHSYYAFSAAGVPSYISGGGGAIPERLDGIERHYLRVRMSPTQGIEDVAVVRVD